MTDRLPLSPLTRRRLLALGGGLLSATATGIARAQEGEPPPDPRLTQETVTFQMRRQVFKGLMVRLRGTTKRPGLLLIPDGRGPTPYFRSVARRFALDGFLVLLPDLTAPFLVPENSEEAENAISRIGVADTQLALDLAAELLSKHPECNGSIGALGFSWGGSYALQFALTGARVKAVVSFYAVPPSADRVAEFKVPVAFHWSENDPRTAPVAEAIEKRMIGAGKTFEAWIYPDTASGFASDPSGRRYNKAMAEKAFDRSGVFLRRWLG